MTKKMVNGVLMDLTPAEEQEKTDRETQAVIDRQTRDDAETARLANVASAKDKLEALGLTTSELKDTFGL